MAAIDKLPVIETAILAIVAIYALYLGSKGIPKEVARRVERHADGSFVEVEVTTYYSLGEPLASIFRLFGPSQGQG
jgi:hypothetical protein